MMKKSYKLAVTFIAIFVLLTIFLTTTDVKATILNISAASAGTTQEILDQLRTQRAQSKDPDAQQSLDGKINALEYKQNVQSMAQTMSEKSLQEICASRMALDLNQPVKDRPSGIITVRPDFLASEGLQINNMWRGTLQGLDVEVYSGTRYETPQQGLVILNIPELDIYKTFLDPTPDGSLEITDEISGRLVLQTTGDQTRYFDIPAQQFASDAEQDLPAADLPPMPTAVYDPCAQFDQK